MAILAICACLFLLLVSVIGWCICVSDSDGDGITVGQVLFLALVCGSSLGVVILSENNGRHELMLDIAHARVRIERVTDEDGTVRWDEVPNQKKDK